MYFFNDEGNKILEMKYRSKILPTSTMDGMECWEWVQSRENPAFKIPFLAVYAIIIFQLMFKLKY